MSNDLKSAFQFSEEEYLLNESGCLSPNQKMRLNSHLKISRRGGNLFLFIMGALCLASFGFSLFANVQGIEQARPFLLTFSSCVLAIFGGVYLHIYFQRRHLKRPTVTCFEGKLKTWSKDIKNRYRATLGTAYYFRFRWRIYQFETKEQFKSIKSGKTYRFHVIRNGRVPIILSAKAI